MTLPSIALAAGLVVTGALLSSTAFAQNAPRGGCLKYGAAGAVAGHFAGRHPVLGAVAGCALGSYERRKSQRRYQQTGQY